MPPIQLLIKPVSGRCNLNCKYCFYEDVTNKREIKFLEFMSYETLEVVIRKAMDYADGYCSFAFQGGEPTLIGLDFYRQLLALQRKYHKPGVMVENVIQTNGYKLSQEWAIFFAKNGFLVGISLDGTRHSHNAYRVNAKEEGSFADVMDTIRLFEKYGVRFNILTVVNDVTALNITKIYSFYNKNKFQYQQYIACLEPLSCVRGVEKYSLTPKVYGEFLITLFELWYKDLIIGEQPYIRQFENYISILMGKAPEACECKEECSVQKVIEADGSVYPCDFYVLDQYLLGNIHVNTFEEMAQSSKAVEFSEESKVTSKECLECEYFSLCNGGCARQREGTEIHSGEKNYYCNAYRLFFQKELSKLQFIAEQILRFS